MLPSILLLGNSRNTESIIPNNYCASCHMDIAQDWEVKYHSKVSCKSCHSQGFIKDSIGGIRKLAITVFKQNETDDYIYNAEVSNATCLQCHNIYASERDVLIVRQHERFVERNYSCTRCHYDTGHITANKYEVPEIEKYILEDFEVD